MFGDLGSCALCTLFLLILGIKILMMFELPILKNSQLHLAAT